jgi:hypothetical protein
MAEFDDLLKKLGPGVPVDSFRLDGRTDEQLIARFRDYVAKIPFDDGHNWADVFFSSGVTPESLAGLIDRPAAADGGLAPQQAFMLAFMQLLRTPRAFLNAVPYAHRGMYYRELLGLKESPARADTVALGMTLGTSARRCFVPAGTLFDAGEVDGVRLRYSLDDSLLVNPSVWTDLRWTLPSPRTSTIAFDQTKADWTAGGARLFHRDAEQTSLILAGRIVASSTLRAPAGRRTFRLTFDSPVESRDSLVGLISSVDRWLPLKLGTLSKDGKTVSLVLSDDEPATGAPSNLDGVTRDVPVIRIGNLSGNGLPVVTALTVTVEGSSAVQYSTDAGVNHLDGPSYPFGTMPVAGAGFNLVSPGWSRQGAPASLTLTPRWVGLPAVGFKEWYANYDSSARQIGNEDFKVKALMMSGAGPVDDPNTTGMQSLFAAGAAAPVAAKLRVSIPSSMPMDEGASSNPCDWPRWIRLELTGRDFGHQEYQKLAGSKSLNPPYTPQISGMAVEWTITASDVEQYVLTPFGYDDGTGKSAPDDLSKAYLYVGLTDGAIGETLSLYWQLESPQAFDTEWQYLNRKNEWVSLADTLVDGTHGLRDSGILSVLLPDDATNKATAMPAGRYWLRAEVDQKGMSKNAEDGTANYPYMWLNGILANGMTASLDSPESAPRSHFLEPLPAGSITRPEAPIVALSPVVQPWPSNGGQAAETPAQFFSRSAERLFHRSRAVTWQDMVALLKAKFDNVFDVAVPTANGITDLPAPEELELLVVPMNAKKDNEDALRPKLSQSHLNSMQDYLQRLASVWTNIRIVNPTYRNVPIEYQITFKVNPDYGLRQLQEQLTLRYMPWMLSTERSVVLGNTLDFYGIVAFIRAQPFVSEVKSMMLDNGFRSVHAAANEVLILTWDGSAGQALEAEPDGRNHAIEI